MKRAAFVTIGQSPRDDILSGMRPYIFNGAGGGEGLVIDEHGLLDDLTAEQIAELSLTGSSDEEERLVTRLRDGGEVVLRKEPVETRLRQLLERLDGESYDLLVVLCTGEFRGVASRSLLVASQAVVDHGLAALASGARAVGILVPQAAQMSAITAGYPVSLKQRLFLSHADPYAGDRFLTAARELAETDFIVMHCMGYSEAQRRRVARVTGRPVLLARRMVADAVAQLI